MELPAKINKTGKCITTAEKCLDTIEDNTHDIKRTCNEMHSCWLVESRLALLKRQSLQ